MRPIRIESRLAQFFVLFICETDLLFVFQKMTKQMARGVSMSVPATMRHHMTFARTARSAVGPDHGRNEQRTSQRQTEDKQCIPSHVILPEVVNIVWMCTKPVFPSIS